MHIRMAALGLLSAAISSGCGPGTVAGNEDSQFFSVPPGSTFTLKRDITIQPDQTSVYLQDGNIEPVGRIDFYRPHCKFELFSISEQARVVKPDTFVVIRILDRREDVSIQQPMFAGLAMSGSVGPTHLTYSTMMYLESKQQPDVFRIDCKRWDWPATGEFLSISEMRQALGDYFKLTLAL